jgi:hypothetical protein
MTNELFVFGVAVLLGHLMSWGFKTLPNAKWQILGSQPKEKLENGAWRGVNFTYYGFFQATGFTLASTLVYILLGSLSIPAGATLFIVATIFAFCVPAARIIARVVERKSYTFTVGGASFIGILVAPWLVWLVRDTLAKWLGYELQVLPVLAALSISNTLGEGIGRLACISFGCCYGKPLRQVNPILQRLFKKRNFIFTGETKKIAYAHGYEGEAVIPIQALTSIIYCTTALLGLYLFLQRLYLAAFLLTLVVTQMWRFTSEFLRADHRGGGKISAYQIMAILAVLYSLPVAFLLPVAETVSPNILAGLKSLWNPTMIILLQCLWLVIFLRTGRSQVTGVTMSFEVRQERI